MLTGLIERDIDIVPGGGFRQLAPILIRPRRGIRQALAVVQQGGDRRSCARVQLLFGHPGNDPVPKPAPSPGRQGGQQDSRKRKGADEAARTDRPPMKVGEHHLLPCDRKERF